jgi:plastocyanin
MKTMKQTPAPLSDEQKQQMEAGTSTATNEKTFNVTTGDFYFTPDKITVNNGDKVTLIITNKSGIHDFTIDELQVRIPIRLQEVPFKVTFTAEKAGTYEFYSSAPGQRELGMKGTLVVQ